MKRAGVVVPLIGLALLAVGWVVSALRRPELELEPFEAPPRVLLEGLGRSLGSAVLSGVVVGQDGRGVQEALVRLFAGDEPAWAYTDARGRFELTGIPEGTHAIIVWSRRHHQESFEVEAPDTELALVLERPFGEIEPLPRLERAPLRGELVAALGGQVLKGYEILLRPLEPPHAYGAPVARRATVGADRAFEFPALVLGEYRVAALPPWARGGSWPDLASPELPPYLHTRAAEGRSFSVLMVAGEVEGTLLEVDGSPIEAALVLLHPAGEPFRPWPPAKTDARGAFTVRDLPPGDYEIEISAGEGRARVSARVEAGVSKTLDLPRLALRSPEHP